MRYASGATLWDRHTGALDECGVLVEAADASPTEIVKRTAPFAHKKISDDG
jgi:hypothetical protein